MCISNKTAEVKALDEYTYAKIVLHLNYRFDASHHYVSASALFARICPSMGTQLHWSSRLRYVT